MRSRIGAADEVPQLALVQGLALARLDEIALDHQIGIAVELDLQALAKFAGVVGGHVRFSVSLSGMGGDLLRWTIMPASPPQTNGDHRPAAPAPPPPAWQRAMAEAVRDPAELCRLLQLSPRTAAEAEQAAESLGLLAPRSYLARIRPGDLHDPLLRQILPQKEELAESPRFSADPLGEAASRCGRGLLWKYRGRLLILTTGTCAVHCRFCFRRCFPYTANAEGREVFHKDQRPTGADQGEPSGSSHRLAALPPSPPWEDALRLAAAEPSIEEVVLSGGDPLTLADEELAEFSRRLAAIRHVRRLRLHSRLPIVIPQRVTQDLLDWLRGTRLTPIVAVHVNHPAEIDAAVAGALGRLVNAGVPTLAQSVLLRGERRRRDAGRPVWPVGRLAGDAVLSAPVGPRGGGGPFRGRRVAGNRTRRRASPPPAALRDSAIRLRDAGPAE